MNLVARLGGACAAALVLAVAVWMAPLTAKDSAGVIYACVKSGSNGNVRIVPEGEACRHPETLVQWNAAGPAGPAGPTGAEGPTGPPGPPGEDGEDASGGPPFVWACTPANYFSGSNTNAAVFVFNGGAVSANVAVQILNKDGVNLAGVNIPIAPGGPPPAVYPGQTGTDTVPVAPNATLFVQWLMAFGNPALGGDIASTVKIISDQPIAVGANVEFSGFHPMMCVKVS